MDLILIFLPLVLIYLSQWYIESSYNKFNAYKVSSNMTGKEVARLILDNNGLEKVRITKIVPFVNIASKLGYVIMVIGLLASIFNLAMFGLILMGATLVFQLVTLPTEFDASRRGKEELVRLGVITKKELPNVASMLYAAAMTYLASFFASFSQMLRLFLQIKRRED